MKTFTIEIDTENSAFESNANFEIMRILKECIRSLKNEIPKKRLYDINGNTVGMMQYK